MEFVNDERNYALFEARTPTRRSELPSRVADNIRPPEWFSAASTEEPAGQSGSVKEKAGVSTRFELSIYYLSVTTLPLVAPLPPFIKRRQAVACVAPNSSLLIPNSLTQE